MKFTYEEKNEILKIVKKELNFLKTIPLTKESNKKTILLSNIIEKIKNSSLSGASLKQIKSLDSVAKKREINSKNKIQNTINLLLLYRPPLHKGTKSDKRFKSSLNSARLNLLNPYK